MREIGCRDMSVEDAIELGQRSIYHATFRDAVSGGTVSGKCRDSDSFNLINISSLINAYVLLAWLKQSCNLNCGSAVYHVTEKGWTKVRGEDVGELHYKYYRAPEDHPCNGNLQL